MTRAPTRDELYQLAKYLWPRQRSLHYSDDSYRGAQAYIGHWDSLEEIAIKINQGWATNWKPVHELEEDCFLVNLLREHQPQLLKRHHLETPSVYTCLDGIHNELTYLPIKHRVAYKNAEICDLNDCVCRPKLFNWLFDMAKPHMQKEVQEKLIQHLMREEFRQLGILPR